MGGHMHGYLRQAERLVMRWKRSASEGGRSEAYGYWDNSISKIPCSTNDIPHGSHEFLE